MYSLQKKAWNCDKIVISLNLFGVHPSLVILTVHNFWSNSIIWNISENFSFPCNPTPRAAARSVCVQLNELLVPSTPQTSSSSSSTFMFVLPGRDEEGARGPDGEGRRYANRATNGWSGRGDGARAAHGGRSVYGAPSATGYTEWSGDIYTQKILVTSHHISRSSSV